MTKICLINPPTSYQKDSISFPMGLVALGTVLKKHEIPVEIVDFELELSQDRSLSQWFYFKRYALHRLEQVDSQVFGISSMCSNFPVSVLLAQKIRKKWPSSHIILGGPQPSAVPEETLRRYPWIDIVVIGEGEETLLELAKCDFTTAALHEIAGIAFRDGEDVIRNPSRSLIADLDTLPLLDFSLIPLPEYLAHAPDISLIEAGRGCPFLCSFCSTALMWERKFRVKSPARIMKEMRTLHRDYGLKSFDLTHDNFTTSHRYVAEFSRYFKKHNKKHFTWSVSARSDTLNLERIQALHDGGCRGFFFGVETGSARMQKIMDKHLNLEQFKQHLSKAVSLGMKCCTSLIMGFPEETQRDLEDTLRLGLWAKLAGSDEVQFHFLSPLTGTALFNKNAAKLEFDPKHLSDLNSQPHKSREINQLIAEDAQLFSSFYTIPTPLVGSIKIPDLSDFYLELVKSMAPTVQKVLDLTGWTLMELFLFWMNWKTEHYPRKRIDPDFVEQTFTKFLRSQPELAVLSGTDVEPHRYLAPLSNLVAAMTGKQRSSHWH